MPSIELILAKKGPKIHTVAKDLSVRDAAQVMNQHKIGAVVVVDGDRVEGIFTERDVLHRVVAEARDPGTTRVADVMTTDVVCCKPETKVVEARSVFKNRRIRHLPVVDDQRGLVGIISIGDLNAFEADAQEQTIHSLQEYLYGRT